MTEGMHMLHTAWQYNMTEFFDLLCDAEAKDIWLWYRILWRCSPFGLSTSKGENNVDTEGKSIHGDNWTGIGEFSIGSRFAENNLNSSPFDWRVGLVYFIVFLVNRFCDRIHLMECCWLFGFAPFTFAFFKDQKKNNSEVSGIRFRCMAILESKMAIVLLLVEMSHKKYVQPPTAMWIFP